MRLAVAFLEAYSAAHPDDEVETLDLFNADIPEFDALAAEGKYRVMSGMDHEGEEAERWRRVVEAAEHFKGFDKYVISTYSRERGGDGRTPRGSVPCARQPFAVQPNLS